MHRIIVRDKANQSSIVSREELDRISNGLDSKLEETFKKGKQIHERDETSSNNKTKKPDAMEFDDTSSTKTYTGGCGGRTM